jgi:hypothetical protein
MQIKIHMKIHQKYKVFPSNAVFYSGKHGCMGKTLFNFSSTEK